MKSTRNKLKLSVGTVEPTINFGDEKNTEIPLALVSKSTSNKMQDNQFVLHLQNELDKQSQILISHDKLAAYSFADAQTAVDEWLNRALFSLFTKSPRYVIEPSLKWGTKLTSGKTRIESNGIHNLGLLIGKEYFLVSEKMNAKMLIAYCRADYDPKKGKHFNIEIYPCANDFLPPKLNPVKSGKYVFNFGDCKLDERPVASKSVKRAIIKESGSWDLLKYLCDQTNKHIEQAPAAILTVLKRQYDIAKNALISQCTDNLDHVLDYFGILHADYGILMPLIKQANAQCCPDSNMFKPNDNNTNQPVKELKQEVEKNKL